MRGDWPGSVADLLWVLDIESHVKLGLGRGCRAWESRVRAS